MRLVKPRDRSFPAPGGSFPGRTDPDEADLWFLPGPSGEDEAEAQGGSLDARPVRVRVAPLGTAPKAGIWALPDWEMAEAAQAAALARVAMLFGALDERLRMAATGLRHRLALLEAAEISWHAGDRITADRLAQWAALRLSGAQDDAQGLARAGWALRRLSAGPGPGTGADTQDIAAFLGRPAGGLQDWCAALGAAQALHPFTRAAMGLALWRRAGPLHVPLSQVDSGAETVGDEAPGLLEGSVLCARLAAAPARGGALFLPVALAGGAALRGPRRRQTGDAARPQAEAELALWLSGAENACLAALLHLDQVALWQSRATEATTHLSGRVPKRLCACLAAWPVVSAQLAEQETGASRAAIQRNLDTLAEAGLIRELTGQGRYRLWTARLVPLAG